ncbi:hypothetical protein HAX54_049435 [Datura stramonium]|uniref:Uncharacterized protein n=1 Tax=Datura stramonium TaxID=4076 RepID=A0ABS8WMV2_DATST|nr:hypothetical protein [Datura stramonium]
MAVVNSLSNTFLITKSSSTAKTTIRLPPHRLLVFASSHDNISLNISTTTTTTTITGPLRIGLASKNKLKFVIEMRMERSHVKDMMKALVFAATPKSPSKSRDEEIVELLQRNWFHIADAAAE